MMHVFRLENKKHMESELSGIFQLKFDAKNGIWFLRDPFYVYGVKLTFTSMRQYNKTLSVITGCLYQGNAFISYLFSNNKFLSSVRILYSILFPNLWKMIAANYELLQIIFEHFLNQFSSMSEQSMAVLGKKAVLKISW